ncbi:MAG: PIG-L family deacetylase [Firmicutes bacterium]|nr:PIG-L family deacetylase [Bacillota bacterium]
MLRAFFVIFTVALSFAFPVAYAGEGSVSRPAFLTLHDPGRRVLVIAPHPDDETFAAGGVIQRAVKNHSAVRVVIVTNGSSFVRAAQLLTKKTKLDPADFLYLGRVRQKESLEALKILGVKRSQVSFLGYPDRALSGFWIQAGGDGEKLAADLWGLFEDFKPTDVYYPFAGDEHPDHRAVSTFVKYVLLSHPWPVREHQYLIHYQKNRWPPFSGLSRFVALTPPSDLQKKGLIWEVFPLRQEEIRRKALAINKYPTQLRAVRGRYLTFIRTNELFVVPAPGCPVNIPGPRFSAGCREKI